QAPADIVLISAAAYELVQGYFVCEALASPATAGGDDGPVGYRVLRESRTPSRFAVAVARGLTPLVGRTAEITLLRDRWVQAQEGLGQVVVLSGEPGIGKSRLVQELKEQVAGEAHMCLECRCLPYYQHSPLYPVIDLLQRVLCWQENDAPAVRLEHLAH